MKIYLVVAVVMLSACARQSEANAKLLLRPSPTASAAGKAAFKSEITSPAFVKQSLRLRTKLEAAVASAEIQIPAGSSVATISVSASTPEASLEVAGVLLDAVRAAGSSDFEVAVVQQPMLIK